MDARKERRERKEWRGKNEQKKLERPARWPFNHGVIDFSIFQRTVHHRNSDYNSSTDPVVVGVLLDESIFSFLCHPLAWNTINVSFGGVL